MADEDNTKDQFGTYSENVGEWTTGTGAEIEATHIRPIGKSDGENDDSDDAVDSDLTREGETNAGYESNPGHA